KSKAFDWGEDKKNAFQTLKGKLCDAPVLALLDGPKDFMVYCDAFGLGIGCVLIQRSKANVVPDALSRKERMKPKRVRAMNMTLQSSIKDKILAAQKEAYDESPRLQKGLDEMIEHRSDGVCDVRRLRPCMVVSGIPRLCRQRLERKSYADKRRKPLDFSVGDYVLLKVSPWKGVVRFGKKGKLAPRFVRPFEIVEKVGHVAYRLRFPEDLNGVHDMFHVSNLKKCLDDPILQVPLDEI
nr:putative reverse transcriptase domain-containing protein [Tanacetum cinerariifolium]